MFTLILLLFSAVSAIAEEPPTTSTTCSTKWLTGYRLSLAQPQKTLLNLSLRECEDECVGYGGCAAFAYGALPPFNRTCELAIATPRTSRSVPSNITINDVDKSPPWDVYVMRKENECNKRSYLFGGSENRVSSNGVPIDCFYRLLSGKRLTKAHSLKAISVNSLFECQDACIRELSFQCRSISYRYMPSGYSYSVSNCELSPFFIMTNQQHNSNNHDFVDDFDYDYFQREPYCKTTGGTSGASGFGVCAVVVRRGGRITPSLAKSYHQVTTPSQCEHLCTTSLFRCRAFAFRHTDRGRDSTFHRQQSLLSPCQLYEVDLERLPSYNVETDPDYDLYEMGRLMGGECMLQGQFNAKHRPVTSPLPSFDSGGGKYDWNRGQGHYGGGGGGGGGYYYDRPQDREGQYGGHQRPGSSGEDKRIIPGDKRNYFEDKKQYEDDKEFPRPPGGDRTREQQHQHHASSDHYDSDKMIYVSGGQGSQFRPDHGSDRDRRPYEPTPTLPLPIQQDKKGPHIYDEGTTSGREGCLLRHRQDAYLAPEVSRATFPVKTLEECRVECLRSLEVLRFPCRAMSFRLTSHQGGTCQLSETPTHSLRDQDFIPSTSGSYRDSASVFFYDDNAPGCARNHYEGTRRDDYYDNRRYDSRGSGGGYYGSNSGGNYGSYPSSGSYPSNYPTSNYPVAQYPSTSSNNYGSSGYYGSSSRGNYWDRDRNHGSSSYPAPSTGGYPLGSYNNNGFYTQNYGSSSSYNRPYGSSGGGYNDRDRYYDRNYDQPGYGGGGHGQNFHQHLGRFTVDGERCLHNCVRNKEAGFYYCQTDQEGAWNFCCRPDDQGGQCGYSKGLSFAWCYVGTGPSRDIWRTCKRSSTPHYVQFLHEKQPPTVHKLNGSEPIGNLTLGDAVDLLEDKKVGELQLHKSNTTLINGTNTT